MGVSKRGVGKLVGLVVLLLGTFALAMACGDGEDRPGVEVINEDGTGSVSGSGSGSVSGTAADGTGTSAGTGAYGPVSDVESHAAITLDIRDAKELMRPATEGGPVDWAAVAAVYENGGNSVKGDGTVRTLASLATAEDVLAQFPDGASVYGTRAFLDEHVRAGLTGTGRGEGLSDNARRQLVEKSFLAVLYGKVLQELEAAREKIEAGKTGDADGAPHNVDEAWAFYVGAPDDKGERAHGLSATAVKREADFDLGGKVDAELQKALTRAQQAARQGDLAAFDRAAAEARGRMNSIFYLASLKYVSIAAGDTEEAKRQEHLAEGWAFFQPIRAVVAKASAEAAGTVEGIYSRPGGQPLPGGAVEQVYAALNRAAVLEALGIHEALVVAEPGS